MTNRVLLDPTGLFISRPGVDVLTAGNADLYFNSNWKMLSKVGSGSFNVPKGNTQTINFGKTFSTPPLVDIFWNVYQQGAGPVFAGEVDAFETGSTASFGLQPSRLVIRHNFAGFDPNIVGTYEIWDYNT